MARRPVVSAGCAGRQRRTPRGLGAASCAACPGRTRRPDAHAPQPSWRHAAPHRTAPTTPARRVPCHCRRGYACCHSTVKQSYCVGAAGREAATDAAEQLAANVEKKAAEVGARRATFRSPWLGQESRGGWGGAAAGVGNGAAEAGGLALPLTASRLRV